MNTWGKMASETINHKFLVQLRDLALVNTLESNLRKNTTSISGPDMHPHICMSTDVHAHQIHIPKY